MILRDWYITNEWLGIACLTSTSVATFRAMRKIKSSSNKAMVSYGIFSVSRKGVSWSQFRKRYKNNRSVVSSWKSPFDWSWRMNTCLTVLRFQFHPRIHVLPRVPTMWFIIVILPTNRQILNIEIHFCRKLCIVHVGI